MQTIPIEGGGENGTQKFSADLGDYSITFNLHWLAYIENPGWNMDLYSGDNLLVAGIMLRGGCDLIKPYNLGIGELWIVGEEPTLDNLGVNNSLVWVAEDE